MISESTSRFKGKARRRLVQMIIFIPKHLADPGIFICVDSCKTLQAFFGFLNEEFSDSACHSGKNIENNEYVINL
jgi:hypothetical protein